MTQGMQEMLEERNIMKAEEIRIAMKTFHRKTFHKKTEKKTKTWAWAWIRAL